MQEKPSSSLSSKWVVTYSSKFQFFLKMRRFFIQHKKPTKKQPLPLPLPYDFNVHVINNDNDLLEVKAEETEEVMQGKSDGGDRADGAVLQRAVKELLFGKWAEKENAAKEIKRLASENVKMRKSLGELGVIPPLVAMVDSDVVSRRLLAVQALNHLSDGTFT